LIMRNISRFYFFVTGWKLIGQIPPDTQKCILVAAPHTSNYDFGYSRAALYILNARVKYLAKKELFNSPLGFIFRLTGGISVERDKSANMVDRMVELFNNSSEMIIMLAPEGSRKLKGKWKTGFYQAAMKAKVPIVLASLDYKKKIANVGIHFYPTGDYAKDMEQVVEFYRTVTPRYPDKFVIDIV